MMKEILTRYDDEIMHHIEACLRAVQDEVLKIMRDRFGLQTFEEVVKFLDGKKACLA